MANPTNTSKLSAGDAAAAALNNTEGTTRVGNTSPYVLERIRYHEGSKSTAYSDDKKAVKTGNTSIGTGFSLQREDAPHALRLAGVPEQDIAGVIAGSIPIDKKVDDKLFQYGMDVAERDARSLVPNYDSAPQEVRDTFNSLSYQIGKPAMSKFVDTLKYAEVGNWEGVKKELLDSDWAKQTPKRALEVASYLDPLIKGQQESGKVHQTTKEQYLAEVGGSDPKTQAMLRLKEAGLMQDDNPISETDQLATIDLSNGTPFQSQGDLAMAELNNPNSSVAKQNLLAQNYANKAEALLGSTINKRIKMRPDSLPDSYEKARASGFLFTEQEYLLRKQEEFYKEQERANADKQLYQEEDDLGDSASNALNSIQKGFGNTAGMLYSVVNAGSRLLSATENFIKSGDFKSTGSIDESIQEEFGFTPTQWFSNLSSRVDDGETAISGSGASEQLKNEQESAHIQSKLRDVRRLERIQANIDAGQAPLQAALMDEGYSFIESLKQLSGQPTRIVDLVLTSAPELIMGGLAGKLAAGVVTRGLTGEALKAFLANPANQKRIATAATRAGIAYTAVSEGMANGLQAKAEILNTDTALLAQTQGFKDLKAQNPNMSDAEVKMALSDEVFDMVSTIAGIAGGAISKGTGAGEVIGNLFNNVPLASIAKKALGKTISGVVSEAPEEALQGFSGEYATNISKEAALGRKTLLESMQSVDSVKGTGQSSAEGLVAGAGSGGLMGAVVDTAPATSALAKGTVLAGAATAVGTAAVAKGVAKGSMAVGKAIASGSVSGLVDSAKNIFTKDSVTDTTAENYDPVTAANSIIDKLPDIKDSKYESKLSEVSVHIREGFTRSDALMDTAEKALAAGDKVAAKVAYEQSTALENSLQELVAKSTALKNKAKMVETGLDPTTKPATVLDSTTATAPQVEAAAYTTLGSGSVGSNEADLNKVISNPQVDPGVKRVAQAMLDVKVAIKTAATKIKSFAEVSNAVIFGDGKFVGAKQHEAKILEAIFSGNKVQAKALMKHFVSFADNQVKKQKLLKGIQQAQVTGNAEAFTRLTNEYNSTVESLTGEPFNFGSVGRMGNYQNLIDSVNAEVEILGLTHKVLKEAYTKLSGKEVAPVAEGDITTEEKQALMESRKTKIKAKFEESAEAFAKVRKQLDEATGMSEEDKNTLRQFAQELENSSAGVKRKVESKYTPLSEFTNHSGGAIGSDSHWDEIGQTYGVKSNHYYKDKTPKGNVKISDADFEDGLIKAQVAAKALGKVWSKKPFIQGLLARNWLQVKNSDAIFAIGTITGKFVNGGTGYAVEMAKAEGKPIYVFDQNRNSWYQFTDKSWIKIDTPRLTKNFAGIGTREINANGIQAIRDVYTKTLKEAPVTDTEPSGEGESVEGVVEETTTDRYDKKLIMDGEFYKRASFEKKGLLGKKSITKVIADITTSDKYSSEQKNFAQNLLGYAVQVSRGLRKAVGTDPYIPTNVTSRNLVQMLRGEDGNFIKPVYEAIGIAATNYLAIYGGKLYNTEDEIRSLAHLGKDDVIDDFTREMYGAGTPRAAAIEKLGQMVHEVLGVKFDKKHPAFDQYTESEFRAALGEYALTGLLAMDDSPMYAQDREISSVNPDIQTENVYTMIYNKGITVGNGEGSYQVVTPAVDAIASIYSKSSIKALVHEITGTELEMEMPQAESPKPVGPKIQGTSQEATKKERELVDNHGSKPQQLNQDMFTLISGLNEDQQLRVAGKLPTGSELHVTEVESNKAANEGKARSLRNFFTFIDELKEREGGGLKSLFYFAHTIWSNRRIGQVGTINTQNDKNHRHLMGSVDFTVSVDTKLPMHKQMFGLAVLEGIGYKINKKSHEEREAKFDSIMQDEVYGKAIRAINQRLGNKSFLPETEMTEEELSEAIVAGAVKGGENMYSLHALTAMAAYSNATDGVFVTNLFREVDGITNGIILGLMQFGGASNLPEFMNLLAKGGIYKEGAYRTYHDYVSNALNQDSYENIGLEIIKVFNSETDPKKLSTIDAVKRLLTEGSGKFTDDAGLVTGTVRKLVKLPLMTIIYGASSYKVISNMAMSTIYTNYSNVAKLKDAYSKTEAKLKDKSISEETREILSSELKEIGGKINQIESDINGLIFAGSSFTNKKGEVISLVRPININPKNATTFKLDNKQMEAFTKAFKNSFGTALTDSINNIYGTLLGNRDKFNATINLSFAVFKDRLMAKVKEAESLKGSSLTKDEMTAIMDSLENVAPIVHSYYSRQAGGKNLKQGLLLMKSNRVRRINAITKGSPIDPANFVEGEEVGFIGSGPNQVKVELKVGYPVTGIDGTTKLVKSMSTVPSEIGYFAPGVSSGAIMTHNFDSGTASHLMEGEFAGGLNVFDAYGGPVTRTEDFTDAFNDALVDAYRKYDFIEEGAVLLKRLVENMTPEEISKHYNTTEAAVSGMQDLLKESALTRKTLLESGDLWVNQYDNSLVPLDGKPVEPRIKGKASDVVKARKVPKTVNSKEILGLGVNSSVQLEGRQIKNIYKEGGILNYSVPYYKGSLDNEYLVTYSDSVLTVYNGDGSVNQQWQSVNWKAAKKMANDIIAKDRASKLNAALGLTGDKAKANDDVQEVLKDTIVTNVSTPVNIPVMTMKYNSLDKNRTPIPNTDLVGIPAMDTVTNTVTYYVHTKKLENGDIVASIYNTNGEIKGVKPVQASVQKKNVSINTAIKGIFESDVKQGLLGSTNTSIDPNAYTSVTPTPLNSANLEQVFDNLSGIGNKAENQQHQGFLRNLISGIKTKLVGPLDLYMVAQQGNQTIGEYNFHKRSIGIQEAIQAGGRSLVNGLIMSAQEVFAHEFVHAITFTGINSDSVATRKLQKLFDVAREQLTPEHLMNKVNGVFVDAQGHPITPGTAAWDTEYAAAKERFDYIFNNYKSLKETHKYLQNESKASRNPYLHEFMALGLTNENLNNALALIEVDQKDLVSNVGESLLSKMLSVFNRMLTALGFMANRAPKTTTADNMLLALAYQLGEKQEMAQSTIGTEFNKVDSIIGDKLNEWIVDPLVNAKFWDVADKDIPVLSALTSAVRSTMGLNKEGVEKGLRLFFNRNTIAKDSFAYNAVNEIMGPLDQHKAWHSLHRIVTSRLDHQRKSTATTLANTLAGKFINQLTKRSSTSITRAFLMTDIVSILRSNKNEDNPHTYSLDKIKEFLDDESVTVAEIDRIRGLMVTKFGQEVTNVYSAMSDNLGYFMATKGVKYAADLMLNADVIASLEDWSVTAPADQVTAKQLIDAMATLQAIKYTDGVSKIDASYLIKTDRVAVEFTIATHGTVKERALAESFQGQKKLMVKGFVSQLNSPHVSVKVANEEQGRELIKYGYKKGKEVTKEKGIDPSGEILHMYIAPGGEQNTLDSGVVSLTNMSSMGTSVLGGYLNAGDTDAYVKAHNDLREIHAKKVILMQQIAKGQFKESQGSVLVAVRDNTGEIQDYRYIMSEETRRSVLKKDEAFHNVLGHMAGHVVDVRESAWANEQAVKLAKADYDANFHKDPGAYLLISANSSDPLVAEMAKMIPTEMKKVIQSEFGLGGMYVHKATFKVIFGQRRIGVASLKYIDETGLKELKLIKAQVNNLMTRLLHNSIGLRAESTWKDIVTFAKDTIVIKGVEVLAGNVLSNQLSLWMLGVPIKQGLADQYEAFNAAKEYQVLVKQILEVKMEMDNDPAKANSASYKSKLARLEEALARSSVHDLMLAGVYQSITEDVYTLDDASVFKTSLEEKLDPILSKIPKPVNTVINVALMRHDTTVYKALRDLTQFSDFVARYALHKHNVRNGMSFNDSVEDIMETFINYDTHTDKRLEYANATGALLFTKYFMRNHRVLTKVAKNHPARAATLTALQLLTGVGLPDIFDSGFFHTPSVNTPFEVVTGGVTNHPFYVLLKGLLS